MSELSNNPQLRWKESIEQIRTGSWFLARNDQLFQISLEQACEAGVDPATGLYRWVMDSYFYSAIIGIRRLIDTQNNTASLLKLLHDIKQHPGVLTRELFASNYSKQMRIAGCADLDFYSIIGVKESAVPENLVCDCIGELKKIDEEFRELANCFVAHHQLKRNPFPSITWDRIHDTIRDLEQMSIKWETILTGCAAPEMTRKKLESEAIDIGRMWGS